MSTFLTVFGAAVPVFLVIGAGYFARLRGWLAPEADGSVMKMVVTFLYPFLLLTFILGNPALKDPANISMGLSLGAFVTVASISLAYLVAPFGGMKVGTGRRTFAFSAGLNNYGYMAIPVAASLFGADSPTMGVLLVYNVGIELMFWTFGILVLTGKVDRGVWRKLLNPPLLALVAGLAMNFAGLPEAGGTLGSFYHVLLAALKMLGACAVPLGLMVSGATMCDLVKSGEWLGRWQVPALGLFLRNALLPALCVVFALSLSITPELKQVLIVQASMPAAVFPIVLARFYGGSPAVAVQVILSSVILGLLTIPLWMAAGLRLLGM